MVSGDIGLRILIFSQNSHEARMQKQKDIQERKTELSSRTKLTGEDNFDDG
jgi:hypothetical protein